MTWTYVTPAEASFFIWQTMAAQEWDLYDFNKMVNEIETDSIYCYFDEKCWAIMRIKWIVQPYSGYMWLWNDPELRGKRSKYLQNNKIFTELFFHLKDKIKIKKLLALCTKLSVARLCQRYDAELMCKFDDLYYKGKSAYVCYWQWDKD